MIGRSSCGDQIIGRGCRTVGNDLSVDAPECCKMLSSCRKMSFKGRWSRSGDRSSDSGNLRRVQNRNWKMAFGINEMALAAFILPARRFVSTRSQPTPCSNTLHDTMQYNIGVGIHVLSVKVDLGGNDALIHGWRLRVGEISKTLTGGLRAFLLAYIRLFLKLLSAMLFVIATAYLSKC